MWALAGLGKQAIAGLFAYIFGRNIKALVARILAVLGIGLVTFAGVDLMIGGAMDLVVSKFSGLPADLISILGLSGIDVFISLQISAYTAVLGYKSMMGGFRKYVNMGAGF